MKQEKREDLDFKVLREKLEAEMAVLKKELASLGRINPDNPLDWEPTAPKMDVSTADPNESADVIEEFETNSAILNELEERFNAVKEATLEIENKTYGFCKKGGEPIEKKRLLANPSARTCIKHEDGVFKNA